MGKKICKTKMDKSAPIKLFSMSAKVANCPTNPEVPIPAPTASVNVRKPVVDSGPKIALTIITGNQSIGFFIAFLNCNIDVPNPTEMVVPKSLSFLPITAKPNNLNANANS